MCLEFSHVNNAVLQWYIIKLYQYFLTVIYKFPHRVYDQYSFQVIPPLGQILAGKWQPYQYLIESIRKFPKQEDFKNLIENAGFKFVTYENLTNGICSIHSGFKI